MERAMPKYIFDRIEDITVDDLKKMGAEAVGIDLDNTTVTDASYRAKDGINDWIESVRSSGIPVIIVSNTYHFRAKFFSKKFRVPYFAMSNKPKSKNIIRAAEKTDVPIEKFAMIGDQLFADVLGANNCGAISVWVRPFMKEKVFAGKFAKRRQREREFCKKHGIEYKEIEK